MNCVGDDDGWGVKMVTVMVTKEQEGRRVGGKERESGGGKLQLLLNLHGFDFAFEDSFY